MSGFFMGVGGGHVMSATAFKKKQKSYIRVSKAFGSDG